MLPLWLHLTINNYSYFWCLGVEIRIVHQVDTKTQPNRDTKILEDMGLAQVRVLDMERLIGAGILHSKMWLVDTLHFYLGSANMDWRSLTQV